MKFHLATSTEMKRVVGTLVLMFSPAQSERRLYVIGSLNWKVEADPGSQPPKKLAANAGACRNYKRRRGRRSMKGTRRCLTNRDH